MKKVISSLLLLASFSLVSAAVNPPDLEMGMQNDEVHSLQKFLISEKLLSLPFGATGYFGASTRDAVNEFKGKKGLPQNGVVDCAMRAYIPTVAGCSGTTTTGQVVKAGNSTQPGCENLTELECWYRNNCLPAPVGLEYGRITPLLYTPSGLGGTELAQINKTFNATVNGVSSTTIGAKMTASDSQVDIQPASCKDGMASGGANCTVTVSGAPRDIYIKVFNGRPGIKPVCHMVKVYRAQTHYKLSLSIDKDQFGSNESFKVAIGGMTRAQLASAFSSGSGYVNAPFAITREGAPASSCEFSLNPNASICQGDSVMSCGILPGDGSGTPEFLCAATRLDISSSLQYPNKNGPVKYTLTIRNTGGLFDTYSPDSTGGSDSITLLKYGTNGTATSYSGCPSGEGVDPRYPEKGCTRCLNIVNTYRSHISTCVSAGADVYRWVERPSSGGSPAPPICNPIPTVGAVCNGGPNGDGGCMSGTKEYSCEKDIPAGIPKYYHGKVLDAATNQPLAGVNVQSWSVVGNMLLYNPTFTCPKTTTTPSGEYSFSQTESQSVCLTSNGYVKFTKAGYIETSIPSGNEFDKLIPTLKMQPTTGGTTTNPTTPTTPGQFSFDAPVKTMSGNTVTFTLSNAESGKVDVCYQVINHPNVPSLNTNESVPCSTWTNNWTGNGDWVFNATNKTLVGTFPANATWNIPGLVVRSSFRKSGTSQVATAKMIVAGGTTPASSGSYVPQSAAAEPTPSYAVSDVVESVTTTVTTVVTTVVDIVVDTVTNNIVDPIIEIVQTVGGLWNDLMSFE